MAAPTGLWSYFVATMYVFWKISAYLVKRLQESDKASKSLQDASTDCTVCVEHWISWASYTIHHTCLIMSGKCINIHLKGKSKAEEVS